MVLLKPTYLIDGDVTDIDLTALQANGVRGLIFDLDSTLLAPHSGKLTCEVESWLHQAKSMFKVAIVTNNRTDLYLNHVRDLLDIPTLGHAAKPRRKAFREAAELMQLASSEVAVIGDRPLTDVLGGFRAGMKTILVWPLKTMNEPKWITFFRKLERCIIKS